MNFFFSATIGIASAVLVLGTGSNKTLLVKAEELPTYVPPSQAQEMSGSQKINRTINCQTTRQFYEASQAITLIVPNRHVGYTISEKPTLLLHLNKAIEEPILTSLVEPEEAEPIFYFYIKPPLKPGIIAIKAERYSSQLEIGKSYRWVLGFKSEQCKRYTVVGIKRVKFPTRLATKLAKASTTIEKSRILAKAGIWYDAISLLYFSYNNFEPGRFAFLNFWNQLLQDIGLSNIEPIASQVKESQVQKNLE